MGSRCSFGLFGVVCYITFKTDSGGDDDGDPDPPHARVEHIKKKMKDILAVEYLRDLVTESYGVEIFWFPINHFFNGGTWAYGDESMWVKKYTRVSGEEGAVQVGQTDRAFLVDAF